LVWRAAVWSTVSDQAAVTVRTWLGSTRTTNSPGLSNTITDVFGADVRISHEAKLTAVE